MSHIVKAIVLLGLVAVCHGNNYSAPLTMLHDPAARCMDGTFGGYYLNEAASSDHATKWIFDFQGGGECASEDK